MIEQRFPVRANTRHSRPASLDACKPLQARASPFPALPTGIDEPPVSV